MTVDLTERRQTPLAVRLANRIRRAGAMPVSDYMAACLQDPEYGYYRANADIGRDFTTAPEISQIFGELIGLWCGVVWQQMGRPDTIDLIELGPGRGTMMRDMLRALRAVPAFLAAARVHLVESSEALAARQRTLLNDAAVPVRWHDNWPEGLAGPAIVVGNEFLDALAADQYALTASGWRRRVVDVDGGGSLQFACGMAANATAAGWLHQRLADARPGDIAHLHSAARPVADWIAALAERTSVVLLLVDYGHDRSAAGDTLQSLRAQRYEHPLCSPGEADLTVQVDFEQIAGLLTASSSLEVDGPVTQAEFLGRLGLVERASRLMASDAARAHDVETGAHRLMAPGGMGTRFKVLGARSRHLPALPGLATGPQ